MFKQNISKAKISNNKEPKIIHKKKSKSINNRNLSKNLFQTKKLINTLSNTNNNNDNLSLYYRTNKFQSQTNLNLFFQKKNSVKDIDSNNKKNIKNIKKNKLKQEETKFSKINYFNELKFKNYENKENIFIGNFNKESNTTFNFYNKKKKIKSLDNKKIIKKNKNDKKGKKGKKEFELNRKIKLKSLINKNKQSTNIEEKKDIIKYTEEKVENQSIKNDNDIEENILEEENNKNLLNKEIKNNILILEENKNEEIIYDNNDEKENYNINKLKEEEKINKLENNDDNDNYNDNKNERIQKNSEKEEEKNEEILNQEIPILKLDSEKNENSDYSKEVEESSKEKTLVLKLDTGIPSSSSGKSSYSNNESSYDGLEVKGEYLTRTKKTNFLNNIKKCLFNKNERNLTNDNSDSKVNNEENFFKFEKSIFFKKRNTAEFSKSYRINLKENISLSISQINETKPKIKSSIVTQPGLDDGKVKINQDSYLILENIFDENLNIYGVFDGHGENGHLISNLVSKFLNQYFKNKINYSISQNDESKDSDLESSCSEEEKSVDINNELLNEIFSENNNFIKNTIKKLDEKSNECNFNLDLSGTTCVLLFILENKIICSNIGDSICYLFKCSNEDRWTHELISVLHKPEDPKESKRIIENGGVIHPYYDENGVFEGPDRVYVKNKPYPGLCLTRSIGDLIGGEVGIISEPDIITKNIDSTCKYLVLGSDGLWDMVKPYDVIRIVEPFFKREDPKGACNALLRRASKNWEKDGSDRDDITIIVIFIGIPN